MSKLKGVKGTGILVVLVLLAQLAGGCAPKPVEQVRAQLVGLSSAAGIFARADGVRELTFPRDFGPHDDFQTEWWYTTGNLSTEDGREFGYELTFFRRGLGDSSELAGRTSAWATNQVYLAHFALTDAANQQFYAFERFERGAAGLAGAQGAPLFHAWLQDWSLEQSADGSYRLHASQDGVAVSLELRDTKGPVLQGDRGYSQKGPEAGNASYYVSSDSPGDQR